MQSELIYPKLLLFGEYSILFKGSALSFPLKNFYSRLSFMDKAPDMELAFASNRNLKAFCTYLSAIDEVNGSVSVDAFVHDVDNGLYLWSNIPSGYGIGSSGALCAAIYRRYGIGITIEPNVKDLLQLKLLFGTMESYFHGKSSGLDPLASYISHPLLVKNEFVGVASDIKLFSENWVLVNTRTSRKTEPLVGQFMSKCEDNAFSDDFSRNYIPLVDKVIERLAGQKGTNEVDHWFLQALEAISIMQLHYFKDLIPPALKPIWQQGLDSGLFYMKLLGAGGGGYYLCYSRNCKATVEMISANGFTTETLVL